MTMRLKNIFLILNQDFTIMAFLAMLVLRRMEKVFLVMIILRERIFRAV